MRVRVGVMVCCSVLVLAVAALSQLTIDATGPIRARKREPSQGRGGSIGGKLAVQLSVQTLLSPPDAEGKTEVAFVLTNSGAGEIAVPISPNPGDFEPSDPKSPYTVLRLNLRMSRSGKPPVFLPGGADLYGNATSPGTIKRLAPGGVIRILTRIAIPELPNAPDTADRFVASASIDSETIKTEGGQVISDSQNLGFATSQEYTRESLLPPHS